MSTTLYTFSLSITNLKVAIYYPPHFLYEIFQYPYLRNLINLLYDLNGSFKMMMQGYFPNIV